MTHQPPVIPAASDESDELAPTPQRRVSTRAKVLLALGILGLTALVVVLARVVASRSVPIAQAGYHVDSDQQITIKFVVTRDRHRDVQCDLRALDEHHGTVGTARVTVPGRDTESSTERVAVRTTARALTGLAEKCWYADQPAPDRD